MSYLMHIKRGRALITDNGLRCQSPRLKDPTQLCNKLLMRKNSLGQMGGEVKCSRCAAIVEIELKVKP